MMYRVPLSYNPIDPHALSQTLLKYQKIHHNQIVSDFAECVRKIAGTKYALPLASGTAAIHLGLKSLHVGPGDEVLVSTFTYAGSVNPILFLGATPVFIDSERHHWNIDVQQLENAVQDSIRRGRKAKAILIVHAYGMPADMTGIMQVSRRYDIPVLEDAAEAFGAEHQGRPAGSIGDVGILSFNNNKAITSYGGGMLLTNDAGVFEKTRLWAHQSREDKPYYEHRELGYNYAMSPLNAAAGLTFMEHFAAHIAGRRHVFEAYRQAFASLSYIKLVEEPHRCFSNRWLTTLLIERENLSPLELQKQLAAKGIETRPVWNPMHLQPLFRESKCFGGEVSESLFRKGLCLPSGVHVNEQVIREIRSYFET